MAKTATITLGGTDYVLQPFTLDDLEEVGELIGDGKQVNAGTTIKIIKIALRRATPTPIETGKVPGNLKEVNAAVPVILELAGLDTNPPTAAPVAA
jgi:hypothetical protein